MSETLEERATVAQAAVAAAEAAGAAAVAERAALVAEMHAAGWSLARIAEAFGVSRTRAHQMVKASGRAAP